MRVALIALVLTGCAVEPLGGPAGTFCESQQEIPPRGPLGFDVLLVFDRAPSMAAEAEHLRGNMSRLASVLEDLRLPEVRIAAISSDLGAGGRVVFGCSGDGDGAAFLDVPSATGAFLVHRVEPWWTCPDDPEACVMRNYEGELAGAMAALVPDPGACRIRQPMEAARRALTGPQAAGFLRERAGLAVIFMGDGDDCSAADLRLFDPEAVDLGPFDTFRCVEHGVTCDDGPIGRTVSPHTGCRPRADSVVVDPGDIAAAIAALKSDPNLIVVAAVAGNPTPVQVVSSIDGYELAASCQHGGVEATPAIRLAALAAAFPQRNTFTSICNDDVSDVLTLLADGFGRPGSPCLDPAASAEDVDPEPGIQPACAVASRDAITGVEVAVPPCRMAADDRPHPDAETPCWWAGPEPLACDSGLTIQVARTEGATWPVYDVFRCEASCSTD